jgi:hypothetical protein
VVSVVAARAARLPPRASRLPPGAGNKGEEPKYEEVELGEETGVLDADGHAATVGANGDGGEAAVGPGLDHVLIRLLRLTHNGVRRRSVAGRPACCLLGRWARSSSHPGGKRRLRRPSDDVRADRRELSASPPAGRRRGPPVASTGAICSGDGRVPQGGG